jgi:hypothetical protein
MNGAMPALPALLRIAFDAAGIDAVLKASAALGGKRIYIPREIRPNDPLTLAMGADAARAISAAYGGEYVEFPKGAAAVRLHLVIGLTQNRASANEIAKAMKITYRQARRLRKLARAMKGLPPIKVRERPRDPRQIDIEDYLHRRT